MATTPGPAVGSWGTVPASRRADWRIGKGDAVLAKRREAWRAVGGEALGIPEELLTTTEWQVLGVTMKVDGNGDPVGDRDAATVATLLGMGLATAENHQSMYRAKLHCFQMGIAWERDKKGWT